MDRRAFLQTSAFAGSLSAAPPLPPAAAPAARPNVIWLFGDQHRGQALSCQLDPERPHAGTSMVWPSTASISRAR